MNDTPTQSPAKQNNHDAGYDGQEHGEHNTDHNDTHDAPSVSLYGWVLVALLILLVMTAGFHHLLAGPVSLITALLIAIAKAVLVVSVFMHLKYEMSIVRLFAAAGVFWLSLMVLFTLSDVLSRW